MSGALPVPLPTPGATPRGGPGAPGAPAFVVFSGATEIPWLRLLRPGFRHCFAIVRSGGAWVVVDPLSHWTTLHVVPEAAGWRPEDWIRQNRLTAVACRAREPARRMAPWRPYTCVEAVKRLLGLRLPGVLTPWQLYRALSAEVASFSGKEKNLDTAPVNGS